MKIYISGKITGLNNYKKHFNKAEDYLIYKYGCKVFNPANIDVLLERKSEYVNFTAIRFLLSKKTEWAFYMYFCIMELIRCDKIYMLKNWKKSKGAKEELRIAKKLNLEVIYEKNNNWFSNFIKLITI